MSFRILVVCTGNVCRSALAERLLRARLEAALGDSAGQVHVASAGLGRRTFSPHDTEAESRSTP